jgi:hypothetical protein
MRTNISEVASAVPTAIAFEGIFTSRGLYLATDGIALYQKELLSQYPNFQRPGVKIRKGKIN